jgi:N-acetylglutamate synthase-like GNAT family acetyltransferase
MVEIREPEPEELREMYKQRWEALRKPFGLSRASARDEKDDISQFVIAYDPELERIIGSARLTVDGGTGQIEYVCVKKGKRRQDLGKRMMEYLEQKALDRGVKRFFLHARRRSQSFFEDRGYAPIGDGYEKPPTDLVHILMEKEVSRGEGRE